MCVVSGDRYRFVSVCLCGLFDWKELASTFPLYDLTTITQTLPQGMHYTAAFFVLLFSFLHLPAKIEVHMHV